MFKALLLLLLASCAALPPHRVAAPGLLVDGHDLAAIEAALPAIIELLPEVRDRMASSRTDPLHVRLLDRDREPDGAIAWCSSTRIELTTLGQTNLEYYLTHELVHWYSKESPFEGLPHFIEEGLADYVACQLEGQGYVNGRIERLARDQPFEVTQDQLRVSASSWRKLDREVTDDLRAIGFLVVHVLGIETLREYSRSNADTELYMRTFTERIE